MVPEGVFAGQPQAELIEKLVFINRCAKVVKGGRRFSFSALLVIGDKQGRVGFGFGKANEVSEAIRKAGDRGRRNLQRFAISSMTIPHEVVGNHGGGHVILKPASPGTGIKAGGAVRAVCDAVGIKNILAKSLGSSNHANVLKATLDALAKLRQRDDVLKLRGITLKPHPATQS
jgi:small subunit ribosomal protein S5